MEKPKSAMCSPNIQGQTPRPASVKSVSIAPTESNNTFITNHYKDQESDSEPFSLDRTPKVHRSSVSRRIVGRPSIELLQKARTPAELLKLRPHTTSSNHVDAMESTGDAPLAGVEPSHRSRSSHRHGHLSYHDLMRWIQKEKARRAAAKARKKAEQAEDVQPQSYAVIPTEEIEPDTNESGEESKRRPSDASSDGSTALNLLQDMLEQQLTFPEKEKAISLRSNRSSRASLFKKLKRHSTAAYSDTDYSEAPVPSCEAILDNSKTLSYSGGAADNETRPNIGRTLSSREKDAWKVFKYEIVRLAHTLKLKGWRRIPLDKSESISVTRLSGALTNAVYVVAPPRYLPEDEPELELPRRHRPRKLLLRIYGSQVDHLIDRDSELEILCRLAQKRIGPRLLGTFTNGRFEEFLNAQPLTAEDLRDRDLSRQIAKRMRELHDGIELLESEIEAGPFVWQNIDKWVTRCEKIVRLLEDNYQNSSNLLSGAADSKRFYLLGADFDFFKEALKRYKQWLEDMYDGEAGIKERLVFAHNDAQYGNILRLVPESESPLLLPTNEHKRLVVIDFEYANANVPGLEFANHFTEWCYDYHDEKRPYACRVSRYPTVSQQTNFLAAYVTHQPSFNPAPGTLSHRLSMSSPTQSPNPSYPCTPSMLPMSSATAPESTTSAQSSFILPAPATAPNGLGPVPLGDDDVSVKWEIERLRRETRAWRGVNSAQWVLWGIVQAKLPSHIAAKVLDEYNGDPNTSASAPSEGQTQEEEESIEEFDYLSYARERAAFFWGDVLSMGIMSEKELTEDIVQGARILDY